jgi:hypothetical protein
MYEKRSARPISRRAFAKRMGNHFAVASAIIGVSLVLGMTGYSHFENLGAADAFLNASMLLGGMGPVDSPKTEGGKLFAGAYALYCGLVFIVSMGILLAPLVHRLMHRFHFADEKS